MSDSPVEEEAAYHATSPPMLAIDGVTILLPFGGRTEDGTFYDGAAKVVPGDPRYDELLPIAQAHPVPAPPTDGRRPDSVTLSMIRRAAGLE